MNKCKCPYCEDKKDIETKKVSVKNENGYDWGIFNVCDEAIKIDRKNGFIVEEITHEK